MVYSDANVGSSTAAAVGNNITVTLKSTDVGTGTITATATEVAAAIAADPASNSLVLATNKGASSGAGVVTAMAATNLAGGADAGDTGAPRALGTALVAAAQAGDIIEVDLY
jgi:hypothetical protein